MPTRARQSAPLWLLLPVAALIACLPELRHGPSCGHDFVFHLQGWMDAAAQLRHLRWPHWSTTSAWHAGEPRFTFYPPLSWLLGAVLTLVLPPDAVPVAFTFLALTGAGLAMFYLASSLTPSRPAALLAGCVYLANPYLLFNAYERTAFAELLAAALFPLLLRSVLCRRLSIHAIALPLAALWLTNAPSGVMGTYAFAFVILCRAVRPQPGEGRGPLLRDAALGGSLGIAVAGFYLLPVFAERRLIQVGMAEIPAMSPAGNFLFGHLGDAAHDQVLHTASLIALVLLLTTTVCLAVAWRRRPALRPAQGSAAPAEPASAADRLPLLAALALGIAFLLTPASALLWRTLPELALLQFPWRLLSILDCVLGAGLALAVAGRHPGSHAAARKHVAVSAVLALGLVAILTTPETAAFRQGCDVDDPPHRIAQRLATGHGYPPTDEYTPAHADNDPLRFDSPGWWLAPASNPNAAAPGTVPNPAEQDPDTDQQPPEDQTLSDEAPRHLSLRLREPGIVVLNLRDWPAWHLTRNGVPLRVRAARTDGLLAVPLPAGDSTLDLEWHNPPAFLAGDLLSLGAVFLLVGLRLRDRLGIAKSTLQ